MYVCVCVILGIERKEVVTGDLLVASLIQNWRFERTVGLYMELVSLWLLIVQGCNRFNWNVVRVIWSIIQKRFKRDSNVFVQIY